MECEPSDVGGCGSTSTSERERKSCTTCSRVSASFSRRRGSSRWRYSATASATIAHTLSSSRMVASRVSCKPRGSSTAAGVTPALRLACTHSAIIGHRSTVVVLLLEPAASGAAPAEGADTADDEGSAAAAAGASSTRCFLHMHIVRGRAACRHGAGCGRGAGLSARFPAR